MNAFLVVAATRHTETELQELPRVGAIVEAAKGGRVPVGLVSSKSISPNSLVLPSSQCGIRFQKDLSEKNPLEILEDSATIVDLLSVFGSGTHRGKRKLPLLKSLLI